MEHFFDNYRLSDFALSGLTFQNNLCLKLTLNVYAFGGNLRIAKAGAYFEICRHVSLMGIIPILTHSNPKLHATHRNGGRRDTRLLRLLVPARKLCITVCRGRRLAVFI